ncbi:MerR family transcriptional regulator [Gorillibacterium sp. sgz500922]|uniref:MerR family transcriptional regulator n=1 Tax=Gorillibacterium sp. sgz500922 TaxID=3446694 RepID=UPI003F67F3F0
MNREQERTFAIKQAAEQTGVSVDTIRYYEKIALLPPAARKGNGHRLYRDQDVQAIRMIACLKKTGMSLEEMRPFLAVSADADPGEHPELMEQVRHHRRTLTDLISSLQQVVDFIDLRLEEASFRPGCSGAPQDGIPQNSADKPLSPLQLDYFRYRPKA